MATPIEDRVAALEQNQTTMATALTNQAKRITTLETALSNAGPRLTALESQYADAVTRYQKADRLMNRLLIIIKMVVDSTAKARVEYLARLPEEDRIAAATQWEKVTSGGRFNPDNGS